MPLVLDTDKLQGDSQYRDEVRHRTITDHFFLAELMGFTRFNRRIHEPAVNLYFPKNPKLPIEQQHSKHFRLHLDPRGTFKTTLGRVDSLQWVLAFPEEITILNEGATQPLARAISENIAIYLWRPPGRGPSPLQLAYPELVVDKKPDGEWNAPLKRIGELDSTLNFTSPQTVQSGWHPWVLNPDDMVETKNSGIHAAPEVRQAVIDTHITNKNTLRHGGYINMRGTRYHPFDLYGYTLSTMDPAQWVVLVRSAITVKSGRRMLPGEFPDEDDVVLNFPELPGMDYASLRQLFHDGYETFMCQQQNDPQGGHIPTFDEELYRTMQEPIERVPALGDIYICWRLPYAGKDYMANSAEGAAVRIWDGKVHVIDAWSGVFTPSRLAEKIVKTCKEHHTGNVLMEEMPGVQYIEGHIRNEAIRKNWSLRIQWLEFQEDDNLRIERIRNLEPMARAGRLCISTSAGKAGELRNQFLNFGLVEQNGIVDCVSRLCAKVPISVMRAEIDEDEADEHIRRQHLNMHNFIFGAQAEGVRELEDRRQREIEAHELAMSKVNNLGLTDILGGLDG